MAVVTVSQHTDSAVADALNLGELFRPRFPSPDLVAQGVAQIADAAAERLLLGRRSIRGYQAEGPSQFVTVSPGSVQFRRLDLGRAQRALERSVARRDAHVRHLAGWKASQAVSEALGRFADAGLIDADQVPAPWTDPDDVPASRRVISAWSPKSRTNMVRRLLTLDYGQLVQPGQLPALATLTLPSEWLFVAPTGRAFKRLVGLFVKAFERDWSEPLRGIWKLEFQRRGAPHLHMLIVPPAGGMVWREWFAETWSSIIWRELRKHATDYFSSTYIDQVVEDVRAVHVHWKASADYSEGLRFSDPRRISVYFMKHNLLADKEYQHRVPAAWRAEGAGPGRFWGYWHIDAVEHSTELTDAQVKYVTRTLRRLEASRGGRRVVRVVRTDIRTGLVRSRKVVRPIKRLRGTFGFLAVNDGASVAMLIAEVVRRV